MGFPRQVNVQAAPAVIGDFCDSNPRSTVDAGAGAFVAGLAGVIVGHFAWLNTDGVSVSNTGEGAPLGLVHREQQSIITAYLAENSMVVAPGFPVTLYNAGSFWVYNGGSVSSAIGQTAYVNYNDGSISFGTSAPTSGACTGGTVAKIVSATAGAAIPATAPRCTASIAGTVMTVTAIAAGTVLGAGQTLSGGTTALGIVDPNTVITGFVSGTNGGVGVYNVSISNQVQSNTITASGGCMTLTGANTTGIFAVGQTLSVASSGSLTAGTTIAAVITGTGGAGTYLLNQPSATAVTAGTITASNAMFLTVDSSSTGSWLLNDLLVGTGIPTTGTLSYITATNAQNSSLTGVGGAGTYLVSGNYTAVTAEAISVNIGVATKWVASSVGAPGELVKMTTWLNG